MIQDNYSSKYDELENSADIYLLKKLKEDDMLISMVNTHYTEYRKTYQQKFGIVNKNKDDKS